MDTLSALFGAITGFLVAWWIIPTIVFLTIGSYGFGGWGLYADQTWPWFSTILILCFLLYVGILPLPITMDSFYSLLYMAFVYLGIGVMWSLFKWTLLLRKVRKWVLEALPQAKTNIRDLEQRGSTLARYPMHESIARELRSSTGSKLYSYLSDKDFHENGDIRPSLNEYNKSRVIGWLLFWPFSVFNYIFNNILQDISEFIVRLFNEFYDIIAKVIFKDINTSK